MDYGQILTRASTIVWKNKYLILLGVIVALGSGGGPGAPGGGGGGGSSGGGESSFDLLQGRISWVERQIDIPEALIVVVALVVVGLALLTAVVLWITATVARGGLIAGVSVTDGGGASDLAAAWSAGWRRGWRLLGIGLLPALPGFVLLVAGLGGAGLLAASHGLFGDRLTYAPGVGFGVVMVSLACVLIPISLALGLMRTFANRACVLEDRGVFASYRRGLNVLVENIGAVIVLFLIQVGITTALAVILFLPGLIMVICCVLWPVLLAISGTITAYFSAVWTLAWREWTGLDNEEGPALEAPHATGGSHQAEV